MSQTFVAVDIETTGLDLDRDRITEVGAVRFEADGRVLDSFESLVNPSREIPRFIEEMTGITNRAVKGAPALSDIAATLMDFAGDSTIVGQNIGFDLAFLRRGAVYFPGQAVDTAALSRLLIPNLPRRGLMDLAAHLGVPAEEHHRALPDARAAANIFVALRKQAETVEPSVRLQLARLVAIHDLAMAEAIAGDEWREMPVSERALPAVRRAPAYASLDKKETRTAIPAGRVRSVFAAADTVIDDFEERTEQVQMAEAVGESFRRGGHYMVEAGTGVGKSLAYLVPAALHALANGERVVISTNTINLQEQLFTKDIPALRRMLKAAGVIEDESALRASLLKGRSNYLCLRRWTASYASNLGDPDFAKLAAAMLLWLPGTDTGDRAELSLDGDDWSTWHRFSAQDTDCLQRPNAQVREGNCFLQRARKSAESAHLVVVNHALLLADIAAGGGAIASYDHLIIDEAHNLEDVATKQFGGMVSRRTLAEALDGIHRPRRSDQREGGIVTLLKAFPEGAVTMAAAALEVAVGAVHTKLAPYFEQLAAFLPRTGEDDRLLIDRSVRAQPAWEGPENAWDALDKALRGVLGIVSRAAEAVAATGGGDQADTLAGEVSSAARRLEELRGTLQDLMSTTGDETIVWIARERDGTASLNSAPLDVGPTLWEKLFEKKRTVVATSATLSAGGSMDYAARRLGFDQPGTLQLGSPFDYERSTLLAAFTDIPDPNDRAYTDAVAAAVVQLVKASGGRTLALFTSHAALKKTAEKARRELEEAGISVLVQGADGSPARLRDNLVEHPRSVIFGTASFWEGVDIRGDALSMLIIAKLPFAVPSDPVYRARSEQYDNAFGEYALPGAVLKFRQGFGRLIRDKSDYGVVAVLDRRVYEKRYGQDFIDALPRCTRFRGDTAAVAARAREWLTR